ncbi:uncharacterized protein LOC103574211 isoform X2 [Microplitis demolitor]|uniref:uncharacterized protein LOC103574211 isoform X2 n=1 Tax=Microplitis demolitor TaxID=69319 RepID=UPI00235B5D1C|nr:uncharacterized protein LOC103574211 isoform X2 [Microplitis demolitor]
MAHQAIIETFTSDEEIDYWVTGDDTIELRGYIDQIEGTKKVPGSRGLNQSMTSLFKVVGNNGSRYRVRVLFWGQKATEFSSTLRDKSIITITCARTSEVNRRFSNPTELLAPLELSITNASQVTIKNKLFQEDAPNTPPTTVTLMDAPNTLGRLIVSYGATHGSGVIINNKYKLRMQVVDYRTPITLKKGVYIKVAHVF